MAKVNDSYTITLKKAHLEWGTHRYTGTRGDVYGEGYIPIPSDYAYSLGLLNSNGTGNTDILGKNLFKCKSADGQFEGILRAQGNQDDANYAKQFSGDKNLKAIGSWFAAINAAIGDKIKVSWTSSTEIIIEKI